MDHEGHGRERAAPGPPDGLVLEERRPANLRYRAVRVATGEKDARGRLDERARALDRRRERLREVERQLEQAKKVLLAGADPAILAGELNRLGAEARALRELMDQEQRKAARPRRIDEGQAADILQSLLSDLDEGDPVKLRQLVATFVRQPILNPDRYTISATFLPDPRSGLHPVALLVGLDQAKRYRVDVVPPTGFEPVPPP
ncbi:hypothetical protein LIP_1878 [Limnochorda pilosa]|uniref:Uncharacterized protein n=1 Tax=Limnochorda pilosa TaxID=1555112 RepID=A0A0K2SKT6_LIMPI|nr:hypothetical protein LIP_1878 [Limnochorda pilosa]